GTRPPTAPAAGGSCATSGRTSTTSTNGGPRGTTTSAGSCARTAGTPSRGTGRGRSGGGSPRLRRMGVRGEPLLLPGPVPARPEPRAGEPGEADAGSSRPHAGVDEGPRT